MANDDIDPEGVHPFKATGPRGYPCYWCGYLEIDERHDIDEDEWTLTRPVPPRSDRLITATCSVCGFSDTDLALVQNHNCDIQLNGGHCEDYPCCGHERGDCNGRKYGSTESILAFENKLRSRGYEDYEIDDIFERMQ